MKRLIPFLVAFALGGGVANAQLMLPGAAPESAAAEKTDSPKKHVHAAAKGSAAIVTSGSIVDRDLLLNGADGELRLSGGKGEPLRIEKFTLPGEVISNSSQKCRIAIIADSPIEAISKGAPDGLQRYTADIPACPLTFDVVGGAALAPQQNSACVFQAADCQASPSGLWGPAGATLAKSAKIFTREHISADASIASSLKALREHLKGADLDALTREQNEFAARRADICNDYVGESEHGYCAARVSVARAALLRKRVDEMKHKGGKSTP